MDSVFHFQANALAKGKATASQLYFSEAESEDQETASIMTAPVKKSTFGKAFNQENGASNGNGYATDDASSDGEQQSQLKVTSRFSIKNKVSKFNNLSTKQPSGDQGLSEEDEHSLSPQKPLKDKKASSTFEGVKLKPTFETERANSLQQQQVNHESAGSSIPGNSTLPSQNMNPALPLSREHRQRVVHISAQKQFDSDAEVRKVVAKNQALDNLKHHPFRHLIFSNFIQESSFKKHLSLTYRGLVYASKCLKGPSEKFLASKQVDVIRPKNSKGKTLLLDLDETLIHSCSLREDPDHIVTAHSDKGEETKIGLKIRPFCIEFLQRLSELWDIFIFTASSPNYADAIVNFIDPNKSFISGVLNRSNCMETKNGFFIKDLRIIRDSDLRSTILVDNLSHSFGFQPDNGVPIIEWHNDKSDAELKHLTNYLIQAAASPDVREFNKQYLKLQELILMKSEELGI